MPRNKRNLRKSKRTSEPSGIYGDVTVNDFANSETQKRFRPKKTDIKEVIKEVCMLNIEEDMLNMEEEDKPWDEKDDSDDLISDEENCHRHKTGHKKRKSRKIIYSDDAESTNYPLDIWFMISEHIQPEDVGRFAGVCQATYSITRTAGFWISLYKRHHKWVIELPENLTFWNMNNVRGLRAAVIRSLFYMYSPFCARIAAEKPLSSVPTHLLRSQCVLQWHSKIGTHHKYFFKFIDSNQNRNLKDGRKKLVFVEETHKLVNLNPEDGCFIIEATCNAVCATAMVIGEFLYHAGLGLTTNLCSHRLRLCFVPSHLLPRSASFTARKYQIPATEILLDPVSDVRIYPWWHPQYWKCMPNTCFS
ncbi:putative transmembrane protein 183BP isoform X1 [Panulirus ornatus]|uniref:putative transmembrane protein 183BP isoform X1 n=2 Tax=Panulirus ornatus TaxID=150431 RepID=UPI003A8413FC